MAIFQNSVLNKHLNFQDKSKLNAAYNKLKVYQARAKEISKYKEEEYQDGFFRDVFVNVFGYTYKYDGDPKFNLLREKKNVNDSKKADGAIIKDGEVICVIELKDTTTRDLSKVETQAFGYFTGHSNCKYVITSNFEKLNFYIKNKIDVEEFNLFTCTFDQFQILYLCLNAENLLNNLPLKVKESSLAKDEKITKDLYKDYTAFKNEAWENLCINHPDQDKLFLYKKAQKLLDRFLFIFFGEDKGLLPENSISKIVKKWQDDSDWGDKKALYDVFRQYFSFINEGRPKRGEKEEIYPYNGGLFYADEFLDKLKLDDNLLLRHVVKLTNYDFDSQVDINILGHIFEHSLSEIEETEAKLKGEQIDKSKGKRKKDGVYYTPKYITKYIVEDTIGKLCNEKKSNLGIGNVKLDNTFITKATKPKLSAKGKDYSKKLKEYRDWLLDLKICDPACGSGAFLNQALEFLISEHNLLEIYILDLQKLLTGEGIQLSTGSRDIANEILENNIFGVDINEESVQIAKLSIWLRTAERGRKLSNLNNNIKCGNSLIDDPAIAGDKAFNWEDEFPQVFAKGGFDVVIGNPPYVRVQSLKENYFSQTEFLEKTYVSATGKYDLYAIFMESSYNHINQFGLVSFILPHKFLVADFGNGIRKFLSENKAVESIVHFGSDIVFNDASTYTCIVNLQKKADELKFVKIKPLNITNSFKFNSIDYSSLSNEAWLLKDKTEISLFDKITKGKSLDNMCEGIYQGLITTGDDIFMVEGEIEDKIFRGYSKALASNIELEAGLLKEVLKGQDIKRYLPLRSNRYVIYPHKLNSSNKTVAIEEDNFENLYPKTFNYLLNFKEHLVEKKIRYKTNPKYWYSLHRSREISLFEQNYLITPQLQNYPSFTVKETNVYADAGGYLLLPKKMYNSLELLPILNSKLLWYFIKNTSSEYGGGYFYFKTKYLEPFCIPTQRLDEFDFKDVVTSQLNQTQALSSEVHKFQRTLQRNFDGLDKLPKKLENWYELTFIDFVKELKKKKIKLSLTEEAEWEDYFIKEQQKAIEIKAQITKTDKEIDAMVYELYGLTDEEIAIIEND